MALKELLQENCDLVHVNLVEFRKRFRSQYIFVSKEIKKLLHSRHSHRFQILQNCLKILI